jgi:hypothetical protein
MNESDITLLFTGDLAPVGRYENLSAEDHKILEKQINDLGQFDYHISNLECPITIHDIPIQKSGPAIKVNPQGIKSVLATKANMVCMANNHMRDFGDQGIIETQKELEANGIFYVGAGKNEKEAREMAYVSLKGKKVAIINYCEQEFSIATNDKAGSNHIDAIKAYYDIQKAKSESDYVIVIYHGGVEYNPLPSIRIKELFHYFIDLGASAVICHHSHVISGVEKYKEKPIYYGIGNFIFDDFTPPSQDWNYGMGVKIKLTEEGIASNEIFFKQSQPEIGVHLLEGSEKEGQELRFTELSEVISNDDKLVAAWKKNAGKISQGYTKNLLFHKLHRAFIKLGVKRNKLIGINKVLETQNIIRNESHREVLLHGLENLNNEMKK